jgi:peptide-methionine (R)-S-oxide reductase
MKALSIGRPTTPSRIAPRNSLKKSQIYRKNISRFHVLILVSKRRGFIVTGAAAIVAAGVWSLRKSSLASVVAASAGSAALGPVTVVAFSAAGTPTGKVTVPRVIKTEEQWKQQLSPVSFEVTRKARTEPAYSGDYWNLHERGLFLCICCGNALFSSETKFDSGTGWPSFWQPIAKENVVEIRDSTFGMDRTAISCRECDAHLGHVFDDCPHPTGLRYCMNFEAMRFVKLA